MTRRRRIIFWIVGVLAVLLVGGRVALGVFAPDIVRRMVTSAVGDRTGMSVTLGDIRIESFADLCIRDFRLTEADNPSIEVFYAEEIQVSLATIPWPWQDRVTVDEVRVVRPRVMAVREPDGRLNFQRLTQPKQKPHEPAKSPGLGREIMVKTITVKGADLRFLDQTHRTDDPEDTGRLFQITDLSLELRLTDQARLLYEFDAAVDDPSWGKAAFEGEVNGKPFAFSLASTDGALTISTENLATLPAVPPDVIERIRGLKPSARLAVLSLTAERLEGLPEAEIELRDLSVTAPGDIPIDGLLVDVSTGPGRIAATVRTTRPLALPGAGQVSGLELNLVHKEGGLVAELTKAEILGGKVGGQVTWKDIARDPYSASGQLDVEGIALRRDGVPYAAQVDGRINIGPGPVPGDPRGNQPLLAIGFRGRVKGGHVKQAPLVMPLEVHATVNPKALDGAIPFQATLGSRDAEVYLSTGGKYFRQRKEIVLAATSGIVQFSPQLLARVTDLTPKFVEQTQARGRLRISSSGGTINLQRLSASRGRVSVGSDNLRMRLPGTERVEQLAFQANVHSADDDPSAGLVGKVTVSRPESGGSAVADLVLDRLGARLDGKVVLARLPVTQELLEEIVAKRSPAAAESLRDRVADLSVLVSGTANATYDRDNRKLVDLGGNMQLADLSAKALAGVGPERVALPITNGSGEIVFDQVKRAATADLSFGVLGGRANVVLHDRPGDAVLQLSTLENQPLRLERLPKPVKDRIGVGLKGKLIVAAQTSAKSLQGLAGSKAGFNIELLDGTVTLPAGQGKPPRVFRTALTAAGRADLKQKIISDLKARVAELRDQRGAYYLPPQVVLNVAFAPFAFHDAPGKGTLALSGPRFGTVKTPVVYDAKAKTVELGDIRAAVDLASVPWQEMAGPVARRAASLSPQGKIRTAGDRKAWARYNIKGGQAAYALGLRAAGLSWVQGQTRTRAKPLDAEVMLERADIRSPHKVRLQTSDPDYGNLTATVFLGENDLRFEVEMRETTLEPSLLALAGPKARKFQNEYRPSGVFTTRDLAGRLRRDERTGKWQLDNLGGAVSARNVSLDGLGGNLPLRSATLKVALSKDLVVLEHLEGFLAEGKLSAKGELALAGRKAFKGELTLDRLNVRQLAAVAKMPANEMVGRLSIRDFAFAGQADDLNTLAGKGHVSFSEGHLWQLPLLKAVRVSLFDGIAGFLRGKFDPTSFRTAESDFTIAGGKVNFPEAMVDSDLIRMVIDGDVYFDSRLDLHVAASVRGQSSPLERLEGLGGLLGEDFKKIDEILKRIPGGGLPILGSFYHITGTFHKPVRKSDLKRAWQSLGAAATDFLKRKDQQGPPPDKPPGGP